MAAKKAERSYGLSSDEVKQLTEEYKTTKKFPNPHRTGAYKFTIDALVVLGVNKPHPIAKAHQAFRKAAGNDWYSDWASKEPRNKETAKNVDGRFQQNLQVLQRTNDYGRRLLEVGRKVLKSKGAVIDLARDDRGNLLVTLNTNSATPQKPGREGQQKAEQERSRPKRKNGNAKSKQRRKLKANTMANGGDKATGADGSDPSTTPPQGQA